MLLMQQDLHAPPAVLTPDGQVCGYATPDLWDLSPQSMLHAFLSERNGIVRTFTLPSPTDPDAPRVVAALLAALTIWWQKAQSTGDLIRWPSSDTEWLHPILVQRSFVLDSICALRSSDAPVLTPAADQPSLLREATPADEEALVHLFEEELRIHANTVPCARESLTAIEGFRHKLARLWHGGTLEQGAPLVLVAEVEGQVVGMAECMLMQVEQAEEPGWTPPGRYGCLDNVCVRAHARGQGIGTRLTQAALARFASLPALNGTLLWYSPANCLAADFWPRFGFVPLWTTYQRLHAPVTR